MFFTKRKLAGTIFAAGFVLTTLYYIFGCDHDHLFSTHEEEKKNLMPIFRDKFQGNDHDNWSRTMEEERDLMALFQDKLKAVKERYHVEKLRNCPTPFTRETACVVPGCKGVYPPPLQRLRQILQTQDQAYISTESRNVLETFISQSEYADLVFVHASSADHFEESQGVVRDLQEKLFPVLRRQAKWSFRFFYYDLGLKPYQLKQLRKHCLCTVKQFPFQDLPPSFKKLPTYVWKPLVVKFHIRQSSVVMWLDASIRFLSPNLDSLLAHVLSTGAATSRDDYKMVAQTSPIMFQYFSVPERCLMTSILETQSGFVVLKNDLFTRRAIVDSWVACAFSPNCLCPRKNSKDDCRDFNNVYKCAELRNGDKYYFCHRYDQSALGVILASLFGDHMRVFSNSFENSLYDIHKTQKVHYFNKT